MNAINRALVCVVLCSGIAGAERIEALEPHMGTMFRIVLYADDPALAKPAIRAAFDRIADLDDKLSDYKPDSELNRACRESVGVRVPISDDLYKVLKLSQSISAGTGGAFDVTIGPVVRLWRTARQAKQIPSPEEISAAMRLTGYRKLHVEARTLRVDLGGMQLDLGAIAKGYAADEALRVLASRGFSRALVAASGDIAIGDAPPRERGWEIGIEPVPSLSGKFGQTVLMRNGAVSTSGDAEQHLDIGTKRYSHIVNPATGMGLTQQIGVTVIARRAIDSDALATAASVMTESQGKAAALRFLKSRHAQGIIVAATP